jgi:hypothetical protein
LKKNVSGVMAMSMRLLALQRSSPLRKGHSSF